jgi:hypothetical protein
MFLAYLDAGSGSQLAMAVVAGFAGTMVAVRMWWRRAVGVVSPVLGRLRRRRPTEAATPASPDQEG